VQEVHNWLTNALPAEGEETEWQMVDPPAAVISAAHLSQEDRPEEETCYLDLDANRTPSQGITLLVSCLSLLL
jgi:hypothetical protein